MVLKFDYLLEETFNKTKQEQNGYSLNHRIPFPHGAEPFLLRQEGVPRMLREYSRRKGGNV